MTVTLYDQQSHIVFIGNLIHTITMINVSITEAEQHNSQVKLDNGMH